MNIRSFSKATAATIVLTALAFLGLFAAGHVASPTLMTPWSSLAYLAVGCSLWIDSTSENGAPLRAGGLLAFAIGAIVCIEYLAGAGSTAFDRLIFPSHLPLHALLPGRPAPIASFRFCLVGVALFLACSSKKPVVLVREWCAIAVTIMCYFGFVSVVMEWGTASPRSISPVAGILGILAAANLLVTGRNGHFVPLLRDRGPAGIIARSLMPAAMILPVLDTILVLVFAHFRIYDSAGKVAVLSINILTAITILWIGTSKVQGIDLLRRNAEGALREREERFRFAQKAARIGTFDWNIGSGASTWTPELEVIYGLPPGGFAGTQRAWENLVHPDDREKVLQRTRESIETGAPAEEEWRVIWPDGSIHWIAGRWQVVNDLGGEPRHVMGINIDVTDRKNMEEALRKSEERLRLATKATNDAIWDIDLKAGSVSWNDTYSMLYGRPDSADSWQFWIDRIHPADRTRTVDEFQAALGSGASSWSAEYRFRRVDGAWAYTYDRAYIARDESGNAWRVIGAMQDLTEQKKAEAALRESEERFRRVFEEGPLGLALVGKDYRFEKVNTALCQMVDYDQASLVRMSFVDISHPDDVGADVELAEKLFRGEIPFYRIRKRYIKSTGETIWINLTASVINGPDGERLHGLAMVEDITEVKRTQEEALFRQKLESVGTLAGGIAHDFNNLLGAVQAQAELALEEVDAGSSCKEELRAIRDVAIRGSEIVHQLMIYAGKETSDAQLVDLSKIVDEMLSLLRISVTKRAMIEANLDRELPAVCASAAQLRQIVMNLITNASDAIGDREGVIRVITRHVLLNGTFAGRLSTTLPDGDYVQLEVSDTGCGMSIPTQARMFDPFFTTKSAGRGLGLAVVQGIVRNLGGAIELKSELNEGSTFQILLPSVETTVDASSYVPPGVSELTVPPRHAVLVVEDEGLLRQAIAKMLRKSGLEVFEAGDGTSAVDFLGAHGEKIDLILLDMTMPGAPTDEILHQASNVKPDIRVVLTSAYSQEKIAGVINQAQIASFIRKPFRFEELLSAIRSSLSS
jgi:two-component system cell cycle sensor histidine kinase/response regulator CckA